MKIEEAINKAIAAGFHQEYAHYAKREHQAITLLEAALWQSLSRALGWKKKAVIRRAEIIGNFVTNNTGEFFEEMGHTMDYLDPWLYKWHQFIDHLAEGKAPEDFFACLK